MTFTPIVAGLFFDLKKSEKNKVKSRQKGGHGGQVYFSGPSSPKEGSITEKSGWLPLFERLATAGTFLQAFKYLKWWKWFGTVFSGSNRAGTAGRWKKPQMGQKGRAPRAVIESSQGSKLVYHPHATRGLKVVLKCFFLEKKLKSSFTPRTVFLPFFIKITQDMIKNLVNMPGFIRGEQIHRL